MTIQKMDKKWKKKWVKALRSGEYEQGNSALKRDYKFCCLGVLCDIIDPRAWAHEGYGRYSQKGASGYLPPDYLKDVKMTVKQQSTLIAYNDMGKSFKWIASYIERYM